MFRSTLLFLGLLSLGVAAAPAFAAAPATATAQAKTVHVIVLDKMMFGPMPTGVRAGDVIEWVNHDIFEHSATARDGSFDIDLKPGATVRTTAKAGSFAFFCKFHPGMTGTLVAK
ncbi:cupredoxin domain-containing protein [Rhodanobacter denitrificans]|uniref:Plastocyanin n=1 Tax=Rhodanobacter denitrificans TaxID=666685 RepID=I4WUU8_9GAMM|nr:cupredoxin domain-containing protein [Rhodanobacter denitrificans]AGG87304.1 plastocyanin [Rhodanobacter denitrificans]EIM03240.1 plastocyanin [Rhodanobacter denitrificans]UJM86490.1 cupredoxin domain-containing protein [Rhodanobacter denitrificans]UJM90437.1 cupredoxin domain-containing protein [Rhodanobacter denitrificans]